MGKYGGAGASIYSAPRGADNPDLPYESRYERFDCSSAGGQAAHIEFVRAGTLTAGDRPELYFFTVSGQEVVVGISGSALDEFQSARRLSREEKVDVAGLHLRKQIETGRALDSSTLFIRFAELQQLSQELHLQETMQP